MRHLLAAALGLPLEIGDDPQAPTVAVDGIDVAAAIRTRPSRPDTTVAGPFSSTVAPARAAAAAARSRR